MSRTLYTGAAGLRASQYYINNIGTNIANVNTSGYKPIVTSFSDLLYTQMYVKSADVLSGQGSKASFGGINPTQSSLVSTGMDMDLAINGDGWFAIETKNGVAYTRSGEFSLALDQNTCYLVDGSGNYVLDKNFNRISMMAPTSLTDTENGSEATVSSFDATKLTSQVAVFRFANPEALTPMSGNLYSANDFTGEPSLVADPKIVSGYLEQSGAMLADGMIDLIAAQRAYQLSAKVLQTADEDEQTVNNLRT
ncbi:MAG: flagellar hook-basal body protein [Oscillospiraceae bacterium]|jgi:flagellar basal body rod protein FlgG